MCSGTLELSEAQDALAIDWIALTRSTLAAGIPRRQYKKQISRESRKCNGHSGRYSQRLLYMR